MTLKKEEGILSRPGERAEGREVQASSPDETALRPSHEGAAREVDSSTVEGRERPIK
ncbi:MAG TPA: hypothetical protein VED87_05990 [Methylocystis sp.]|nr:hypothetical protein [Methylocystis sp.]